MKRLSNHLDTLIHGVLKVKCTFSIKVQPLFTIKIEYLLLEKSTRTRYNHKMLWDRAAAVKSSTTTHGSDYEPDLINRVATAQRSRTYISNIPQRLVFALWHSIDSENVLNSSTMWPLVYPHWPNNEHFTKYDALSIHCCIVRLLPIY